MARRSKYSRARGDAICAALKGGNTRRTASIRAGIHPSQFYRWLDAHASFREAVEQAEAECEAACVAVMLIAAKGGDWRAALEWLKRRRPQEWSERIEHAGVDDQPIVVKVLRGVSMDDL